MPLPITPQSLVLLGGGPAGESDSRVLLVVVDGEDHQQGRAEQDQPQRRKYAADRREAAEAICRRWPRGTRPRLIALTALAGPGDQERCLKAGFDDYMSKPVHLEELREAFKLAVGWRTAPTA